MDFAISLNPDASSPMYRQLYEGLRRKILAGNLAPGQRVPSTRTLSQRLGVSRNTVAQSYAQLLSEGYFQAIVKDNLSWDMQNSVKLKSRRGFTDYLKCLHQMEISLGCTKIQYALVSTSWFQLAKT